MTKLFGKDYLESIHQKIRNVKFKINFQEDNYPVFKARWKALFRFGTEQDWTDASLLPFPTPVKKQSGFVHSYFQGMRFGAEQAFMDIGKKHCALTASQLNDVSM